MKPKIFIGSSTEQKEIAESINQYISPIAEIIQWNNAFRNGNSYLSDLQIAAQKCDFAIFVINPDDKGISRNKEYDFIRDNIVFEMGMFIGALGADRVIPICSKESNPKIMSDYSGITFFRYDTNVESLDNAIYSTCIPIRKLINDIGKKNRHPNHATAPNKYEIFGFDRVYNSYLEAEADILADIESSAGPIRLFLHIASQNIGFKGTLFDVINDLKKKQVEIRILHTDENSPLFNKDRLLSLGKDPEDILTTVRQVSKSLKKLETDSSSSIRHRVHHLPFIWRLYAFDTKAYLMPYYSEKDATKISPVLVLNKNPKSMYNTYIEWFDSLWERCAPKSITIREIITPATPAGSALFLIWEKKYHVFGIPKRDLIEKSHVRFYGLGGKRDSHLESFEDCAFREGNEETQNSIGKLSSADSTDFFRANGIIEPILIKDSPIVPRMILEKKKHSGYGSMLVTDDHYYVVGYNAELKNKPMPSREIGAILYLTDEHLKILKYRFDVSIEEMESYGAIFHEQEGVNIDRKKTLLPHGTAAYLVRKI